MTNDTKLQQEVQSAIHALPLLKTEEIDVVAQVGVITLIGVVDSIARKIQVEDLTRKIHGVESVIGNITINPVEPKNSDENKRINETIDVFQHNPELPNEKI